MAINSYSKLKGNLDNRIWIQMESMFGSVLKRIVKQKIPDDLYKEAWTAMAVKVWESLRITEAGVAEHVGYIIPENQNH